MKKGSRKTRHWFWVTTNGDDSNLVEVWSSLRKPVRNSYGYYSATTDELTCVCKTWFARIFGKDAIPTRDQALKVVITGHLLREGRTRPERTTHR